MLTAVHEDDGDRVLTVRIHEATIDAELISALESVLNDAEHGGIENVVLQFSGDPDSVTGEFPAWRPGPARRDMRYFARWDLLEHSAAAELAKVARYKVGLPNHGD